MSSCMRTYKSLKRAFLLRARAKGKMKDENATFTNFDENK